ncbi:MAG: hypothetical protein DCC75_12985 [Proteobacteria bacterium]|nr:MAG: hypothetical protein DCC75_12985 [Pseudomonadota bacterium]
MPSSAFSFIQDLKLPNPEEVADQLAQAQASLRDLTLARVSRDTSAFPAAVAKALEEILKLTQLNAGLFRVADLISRGAISLSPTLESEPLNIVFQRHERSVANEREKIMALPDDDQRKIDYLKTPNYQMRLTSKGRQRAELGGVWMRENLGFVFDVAFCSDYLRPKETAAISFKQMGLDLRFRETPLLGERHWGDFEGLEEAQKDREYERRVEDARRWTPPRGEPILLGEIMARLFIGTLHRKHNMQNIFAATHGERIVAFRSVIERIPVDRLAKMVDDGVPNGGLVHYTRQDPVSKEIAPHISWVRLVCPWDLNHRRGGEVWDGSWRKIERPTYSADDLLAQVAKHGQIFDLED